MQSGKIEKRGLLEIEFEIQRLGTDLLSASSGHKLIDFLLLEKEKINLIYLN